MEKYKIYTKSGDKGKTGLIGGTRVLKSDERLEAYGTIDELNCHLGMIRSYPMEESDKAFIVFIQQKMFAAGAYLATDQDATDILPQACICEEDVLALEDKIDEFEELLPILTHFIIPGGHPQVSSIHVARAVCRRAERLIIRISEHVSVDDRILRFMNRLSDFLFVFSRKITKDHDCEEIPWNPS